MKRPLSITIIAVLLFLFGLFGIVSAGITSFALFMTSSFSRVMPVEELYATTRMLWITGIYCGGSGILSLAIGIGLFRGKNWAWWAFISVFVASSLLSILLAKIVEDPNIAMMEQSGFWKTRQDLLSLISLCGYLYFIYLIALFFSQRVKEFFAVSIYKESTMLIATLLIAIQSGIHLQYQREFGEISKILFEETLSSVAEESHGK